MLRGAGFHQRAPRILAPTTSGVFVLFFAEKLGYQAVATERIPLSSWDLARESTALLNWSC